RRWRIRPAAWAAAARFKTSWWRTRAFACSRSRPTAGREYDGGVTGAATKWLWGAALLFGACGSPSKSDSGTPDSGPVDAGPKLVPESDPHLPWRPIANQGGLVLN